MRGCRNWREAFSCNDGARMNRTFDVIIVGAGVIGTVMASLLAARGLTAANRIGVIADRLPEGARGDADWDLRVFALSRASERILKMCGIWNVLPPNRVSAYQRMCVWDAAGEAGGKGSLTFDSAELAEPNLGFIADGSSLQRACLQAARQAGVSFIEASLGSVEVGEEGVRVRLTDGRELSSDFLIGADGPDSRTRELLGIETAGHAYWQDALVAHVRTAKSHQATAWQRFLPTGPLAFLPLPDGRSSIVWSAALPEAKRLRGLDAAAFGAALTAASGAVLGECVLTTGVAGFPLRLQYALEYARPRAVLVGDAAHVVHPLAGQGLNLGLLDCAVLAEVLGERSGKAFGEFTVLRRYERRRRSENLLSSAALDGLERLFSASHPISAASRSAGLGAIGKLPLIKRHLARRALGMAGDIPQFLTREAP